MANVGTLGEPFDPVDRLERLTGRRLDSDTLVERRLARERQLSEAEELREGVAEYLQAAGARTPRGHRLEREQALVQGHLTRLGIEDVWACVVCANGDVARAKPAPLLYLEALDTLEDLGPRGGSPSRTP